MQQKYSQINSAHTTNGINEKCPSQ